MAEDPVLPQLPPGLQGRRRKQELRLPLERYTKEAKLLVEWKLLVVVN